jgi:plastocyanin
MNRTHNRRTWKARAVALALGALAVAAAARPAGAADARGPTAAEFARLEREVAEQRQLIIQMLSAEQERYNILLKLLQSGGQVQPGSATTIGAIPPLPSGNGESRGPIEAEPSVAAGKESPSLGVVTGHVQARSGSLKDAYVYLDQMRGALAHGRTVEIQQKDKQFLPRVAVVQRGTSVVFPNMDAVYHNVFSTSGRNSFDLGAYRVGETPRSVVLTTPGLVEVFCNIHSRMSASILVVPSAIYAKVGADGSFRLENVPVGTRKLTVWSPTTKPAQQKIDVSATGSQASFTLDEQPTSAHLNKIGQPYGSYKE